MRRLALLVGLLAAPLARGEEREWTIALTPSYALAYVDARGLSGGAVALDLGYALSDALSLRATGVVGWHAAESPFGRGAATVSSFGALVGISYRLDVIRIVPSFDLAVGALGLRGDGALGSGPAAEAVLPSSTALGLELGFAVDYLLTRRLAVGAGLRYQAWLTELTRIPMSLYVGPRVTLHLGGG